ncbi:Protein DMP8 [Glycine soja]
MNMDLNEQQIDIKVYSNNATPAPEHETLNPSSNPPQPKKCRALMAKGIQKIYQKPPSSPSRWSSPPSTRMVNVHPRSHTLLIHFLLFVCALSCFFFHFTDSFHGTVYYGFVTPLWPSRRMIGSPIAFPPGREKDMEQVRESFLLMVGIVCTGLFLIFPTFRHGIGWMSAS